MPKLEKIEKITPKIFFIFQEVELFSSKIKKFLIFQEMELSRSNMFFFFQNWNFLFSYVSYISGRKYPGLKKEQQKKTALKKFLIFSRNTCSNILGSGTFLYFLKKAFLIFRETKFSTLKNKKF